MIQLKKLTLNNFMCVAHAELDFNNGVNLIVGSNGQGKSTVLQAIALCLLEDKRSDRYQEYIMLGKDSCSVSLDADIKGSPVKINILLNSKSTGMERTATYNGRVYTNSEVTTLLESFDIAYYADIIMSMQDEDDITKLKPSEREAYLQKLFQFDFTEKVGKLKTDLDEIKKSIDYQNAQISFNQKSIEERSKEIRELNPVSFTDADILELNSSIKTLNDELVQTAELLKKKDELLAKKISVQNEMYSIKHNISSTQHDIEMIKSNQSMIDSLSSKLDEYKAQSNSIKKDIEMYKGNVTSLNVDLSDAIKSKELISSDINNQYDVFTSRTNELSELNVQLADANAELNHAQKHVDMIKLGTCPECGHNFDNTDQVKYNDALTNALKNKESIVALQQSKQAEVRTADANVKALREKLRDAEIKVSDISKDISTYEYKIKDLESQLLLNENSVSRINEQIQQYSSKVNEMETLVANIDVYNANLEEKEKELLSLDNNLRSMDDITAVYTEKQTKLMQLQKSISDYNEEISQNNIILHNNENIKKSIDDMNSKIDESKKSVENYRRQKATYDDAITLLDKTFPAWLILKTCQMLEKEMNSVIQVVFPQMAVKLFQNKRGVEFFYTTNINNGRIQTKENLLNAKMASGFEKAILSIAFKVALCRAYNLRFAFMDEIDQAGTEENSEALFKAILSNDLFDQLFIISHKPTVRDVIHSFAPSLNTFYVNKGVFTVEY